MGGDGVRSQVDEAGEPLVRDRTVVTLEEILDNDFPVGSHVIGAALSELERCQRRRGCQQHPGKSTDRLVPTRGLRIEPHEDELPEQSHGQGSQRIILVAEARLVFRTWRCPKTALQVPGPGVVVALERAAVAPTASEDD